MPKKVLNVDWKLIDGAAVKKRILRLKANPDGYFICPVNTCLHVGFRSDRGLRKHIDSIHGWYYYFNNQPEINRNEVAKNEEERRKNSTHKMPAFSLTDGVGKEFLNWLSTPCGGGKSTKQGMQIGRRGMKFLMASMGSTEVEKHVSEEHIDCCLGSPSIIMKFLKVITEEWRITSSAALNYMKAINDLLDFRKANGVSDDVLRSFAVTEVYIRRGKENLAKEKKLEYSRNLDLEQLIARQSWATIEEMEQVIPYHVPKYKHVLQQCSAEDAQPSISQLAFATRFIATFLFLRVKCTRPMTYQFITLQMLENAKVNGGFIDQTSFKTEDKYAFDTLILPPEVLKIIDSYVHKVRPFLNPSCDYLVLTTNGKQYSAFGSAMSLLVHQAIGKYVNPTRYRQIIESESAERLTPTEMDAISRDQKHSSYVAKRIYQKRLSRDVAAQGKSCMQKIVGAERDKHTKHLASSLGETTVAGDKELPSSPCRNSRIENEVASYGNKSRGQESVVPDDDMEEVSVCLRDNEEVISVTHQQKTDNNKSTCGMELKRFNSQVVNSSPVTGNVDTEDTIIATITPITSIVHEVSEDEGDTATVLQHSSVIPDGDIHRVERNIDVEVKKEEAEKEIARGTRLKRFTPDEDLFLKEGVSKYGVGRWSCILADKGFTFHPARTRDTLRMRADTIGITNKRKRTRKQK